MKELCVTPTVVDATAGEPVAFVNADPYPHNVTGLNLYGDLPNKGDRLEFTFTEPGIYPFACTLHPGMAGAVVIGGHDAASAPLPVALRTEHATSTRTDDTLQPGVWLAASGVALVAAFAIGRLSRRARNDEER